MIVRLMFNPDDFCLGEKPHTGYLVVNSRGLLGFLPGS